MWSAPKVLAGLLLAAAWSSLGAGCATPPAAKVAPGASLVVSVPKAAFYKYGPAQSFGPDFQLAEGQPVTMVEHGVGFSRVTTSLGGLTPQTGYVSNDEIQPAPPAAPPAPFPPAPGTSNSPKTGGKKPVTGGRRPGPTDVMPMPGMPLFDSNEIPENPEPISKLKFRY